MIPFLDLKAQYRNLQAEILPAIAAVLESSQFVLGKEVARFEEEFAEYCGVRHCVAVNSGTSALHLALLAAGVKPGDEVITTSFTFVATVAAILYAGAKPVLVDIHPESYTIDPELLPAAVTPRTRAILPVHLYGQPADMDPIMAIARTHGLVVIEDACQAHGATYKNRKVGGIGELGCFSFYPGKNLGAYGEGGAVTTNTAAFDETLRMMRDWGQREKYLHELQGFNYRMDGIQGAILRVKLRRLNEWTEQRRSHASLYDRLLRDSGVLTPSVQPCTYTISTASWWQTGRRSNSSSWDTAFIPGFITLIPSISCRPMPSWGTGRAISPCPKRLPNENYPCRCLRSWRIMPSAPWPTVCGRR